ncbi:hypothetical protein [Cerasicoccus arenae]|uniref:hypothetical protein n=1 Tax=Cerasicoccus arenae TaxID=424488 RepID=UPI0019044D9E|nr:hypothetical protein [Cerasicoccus arenae]MBK1859426.1 hypothetical protein [Cerasicoccus arenae]
MRLLWLLAIPCLFLVAGCGDPAAGSAVGPHAPDRSDAIREQYLDREAAVEASMEGRMAYQVKPRTGALGALTEEQLKAQRAMLRTLLIDAGESPLQAAIALDTVNAAPELAPDMDLAPVRATLKATLGQARARLGEQSDAAPVTVDSVNDLTLLTVLSLALGREEYAEDYERGVLGLLKAMDSTGRFGDLRGGIVRAFGIDDALIQAAYATALQGDDRLRGHSYFAFAPYWFMHRFQPNGAPYITHQITPEQARAIKRMTDGTLSSMASLYPSPEIQWWFEHFGPEESSAREVSVNEFLGPNALPADFAPPPYGLYPHAGVLFWRSSWERNADSLLVRGAVEADTNSVRDAGNLLWIAHGDPVLVDADMAYEVAPVLTDETKPRAIETRLIPADNVLRVGTAEPIDGRAPIITRELNSQGGNLRIDASALFPELGQWHRDVFWEAGGEVRIIDTIRYALGQRERTSVFWHLNATEPVNLEADRSRTIVEWDEFAIVIQGNSPLEIEQFLVPDGRGVDTSHIVLAMRTIGRPPSLRILTRVLPREKGKGGALPKKESPAPDAE